MSAQDAGLSWREQLGRVRERVVKMEERRETEKRLQRERSEGSLKKQLAEDTPELLNQRFNDLHQRSDRAARGFYPLADVEGVLGELSDMGDLLRFYADCMKSFSKVFTPGHKITIPKLLKDLAALQHGLDRQLRQWRVVAEVANSVAFRPRQQDDDRALVAAAKSFSERAHGVPLDIPGDFFAHEGENFWVAVSGEAAFGYVKYWPDDKVVTMALSPRENVNFSKLVRAVLYRFHTEGPLAEKPDAVRVRVSYVREVKFFTDMGFVRAETKGPSDWIYQRPLD